MYLCARSVILLNAALNKNHSLTKRFQKAKNRSDKIPYLKLIYPPLISRLMSQ